MRILPGRTVIIIILLFLLSAGCTNQTPDLHSEKPQYGGIYHKPLEREIAGFDPVHMRSVTDYSVGELLYDSLVKINPLTLRVEPHLAKDWKFSKDRRIWTFKLRKGVLFHNGREVTSSDWVYSFTRLVDPKVRSERAWIFDYVEGTDGFKAGKTTTIKGFIAPDKYTLQIRLKRPFAPFIHALTMINASVVPREAVEAGGGLDECPIGTGPFIFTRKTKHIIAFTANARYFKGKPYLSGVEYIPLPGGDLTMAYDMFEQGKLDETPVPEARMKQVLDDPEKKRLLSDKPLFNTYFIALNVSKPPFNNIAMRQAFASSINRTGLSIIKSKTGRSTQVLIPPGIAGHSQESKNLSYNLKESQRLLSIAGAQDQIRAMPIVILARSEEGLDLMREVAGQARKVGFNIIVKREPDWNEYIKILEGGQGFNAASMSWWAYNSDPDNFLYSLGYTGVTTNYSHYSNPEFDKLVAKAREIPDPSAQERINIYRKAEGVLLKDIAIIPLYHLNERTLYQPYVKGTEVTEFGFTHSSMAEIWLDKYN